MTSILMVILALIYDGAQALIEIITLGLAGWLINPLIDIWAFMSFYTWFKFKEVSFMKPSKALTMGGSFFIEMFPFLNDLPTWTLGVIIMLAQIYAEDIVASASPETLKSLSGILNKIKNKKNDSQASANEQTRKRVEEKNYEQREKDKAEEREWRRAQEKKKLEENKQKETSENKIAA